MLKKSLFIILLCISTASFSQDYLDKMGENICSCLDGNPDLLSPCIANEALNHREEILRDYNVDVRSVILEQYPPALLNVVMAKMSGTCPETVQSAMDAAFSQKQGSSEPYIPEETYYGTITSFSDQGVLSYMVENDQGEIRKFLVLGPIECDLKIEEAYQSLVGKQVGVMFIQKEIFDPVLGKYVKRNVISVLGVK